MLIGKHAREKWKALFCKHHRSSSSRRCVSLGFLFSLSLSFSKFLHPAHTRLSYISHPLYIVRQHVRGSAICLAGWENSGSCQKPKQTGKLGVQKQVLWQPPPAAPSASNEEHRYHTVNPRLQLHRVYLTTLDAAKSSISFYIKRKLIMERNE